MKFGSCQESKCSPSESKNVRHWQNLNPVAPEALIQVAIGSSRAIYHGGLLHSSIRYFDPEQVRPGLPCGSAAVVGRVDADGIPLTLVSTDPVSQRHILTQAGGFSEHNFTTASVQKQDSHLDQHLEINDNALAIFLGPSAQTKIRLGMDLYAATPTYDFPDMS